LANLALELVGWLVLIVRVHQRSRGAYIGE
jgi:hypothetical protein